MVYLYSIREGEEGEEGERQGEGGRGGLRDRIGEVEKKRSSSLVD